MFYPYKLYNQTNFSLFQFGSNVTDHRIFAKLTQHWETEFHKDMEALNVCGFSYFNHTHFTHLPLPY